MMNEVRSLTCRNFNINATKIWLSFIGFQKLVESYHRKTHSSENDKTILNLNVFKRKQRYKIFFLPELGIEPRSGACEAPVLTVIRFGRECMAQIYKYTLAIIILSIAFLHHWLSGCLLFLRSITIYSSWNYYQTVLMSENKSICHISVK